jgi:dienelactone hydrolase
LGYRWLQSDFALDDTLDIIGNVPASILILQGEGDTKTPVEQAYLLEQKLTELRHSDHTLITYPSLGHTFYPVDGWIQPSGPIQEYVLSDLVAWHKDRSRKVRYLDTQIHSDMDTMEQLKQEVD